MKKNDRVWIVAGKNKVRSVVVFSHNRSLMITNCKQEPMEVRDSKTVFKYRHQALKGAK